MPNSSTSLRQRFYEWRQLRPIRRFLAAAVLLIAWPARFVVFKLTRAFSKSESPKRIVVIQLAGLGDVLMATPAWSSLQQRYPGVKIDLITLHGYVADAFENHPRLNSVATLPAYPGKWIISKFVNKSSAQLTAAVVRYYPELVLRNFFSRYDIGLSFGLSDFDRNLGNALLFCLNVPTRIGSVGTADELLTDAVAVNPNAARSTAYLQLLAPLGVMNGSRDYEFPVAQSEVESVKLALRSENVGLRRPLAIVQPGGKMHLNSRRWPAEYFSTVCEYLSREGFEIVLTGDKDDVDVCDQIARTSGLKTKSFAGRLTFKQTAALLSLADLCITNDTSTLHLAEAVKAPRVISIFGPTNADILAPLNSRNIVLRSKLPCAPCMAGMIDGNTERCWRDVKEECLWGITPDEVVGVLKELYPAAVRVASA